MRPLVTAEEMRAADEATISTGTPGEILMERAGRAVARAVIRELGTRYGKRVTCVCGKGNNGGDGFVAARVLHAEGVRVVCCLVSDAEPSGAAKHHLELLRATGVPVVTFDRRYLRCDAIVDAVFGTGFSGEPREPARSVLDAIHHVTRGDDIAYDEAGAYARPPLHPVPLLISVDVASAGRVRPDLTVALAAEKRETFFRPDDAGRVEVADIGIPVEGFALGVVERGDVVADLPIPAPEDHKRSHGHVAVLTGSSAVPGAPVLVARGAARMGAGYVSLGSTPAVIDAAAVQVPEVLKHVISDVDELGPDAWRRFSGVLERAGCVAVGPGLGTGEAQAGLLDMALESGLPLVLDADALTLLAGSGRSRLASEAPTVLTPHPGEMAKLLDVEVGEVQRDRVAAALEAAERFDCLVVLKGRHTIVARGSSASVVSTGGPELATAGTGDVLTGAIAALLARSGRADVTAAACFVHGVAGALAAERVGRSGVVAWDVAEALPAAIERIRGPYAGAR
ncbi:MAG: NAD(P)H-hydrate dehydratase [Actinomycetota bacterium]